MQDPFVQQQNKWFHADNKDCPGHHGLAQEMHRMLLQLSFAHRKELTDSVQACHEPTFIFHHIKQARNNVIWFFTTNQLLHVDELSKSSESPNISNDDGHLSEDNTSS